jgi:hypothetical protein
MSRRILSALLMVAALGVCCCALPAQSRTITIRVLDGKTGKALVTTSVLIRVDHEKTVHANWVSLNEDLTGKATLPAEAALVAAQATYDNTIELFVNCDSVKDNPPAGPHWYKLSDILTTGVVAPNGCSGKSAVAKPGEFVFFARAKNWRDRYEQDFSE